MDPEVNSDNGRDGAGRREEGENRGSGGQGGYRGDRSGGDRGRAGDGPRYGERREGRPGGSYGSRDRGDRPGGGYRDNRGERPAFNRDDRPGGGRPPYNRDDRPGGGYRDNRGERPAFNRDDRPGGERRSYGDRDQSRGQYGPRSGGERRPFNRDDRPGGGRPSYNRDDRPGGGYRDNRGERPAYNRDDRPGGGYRDNRGGERRSYGDRDGDRRPSYSRDDRPGRPFGDRDGAFRGEGEGSRTRYSRHDGPGDRDEAPAQKREELPPLAPDITAEELDKEIREELRSLPLDLADLISRHLVAAERALGEDNAEQAYEHTKVARRFAARIGVIREAVGIAAYRAGHFAEALSDLRAARRMTGSDSFLPIMADCERGLGRPERALDLVRSKEAERLDRVGKIELAIVESGARRDLHQKDAAVITLQRLPELRDTRPQPWSARLAFAYADALADAGHEGPATEWFGRAMAFDEDGETDAAERYAELTGAVIEDIEEEDEDLEDLDVTDEELTVLDEDDEDEENLDDDASIDDAADLNAEIEAEDDLDELEPVIDDAPEDEAPLAEKAQSKVEERVETGVGPAFIEPDFGDILDEPLDSDGDEDEDEDDAAKSEKK